jgi:transposase
MIDYDTFSRIKDLTQNHGLTRAQIARHLDLDPRTVAGCLSRDRFLPRKPVKRASKLDPFKNDIIRLLDAHPYSAAQIMSRIREMGFDGGYSIIKDYVRKIRPRKTRAFLTLSFLPGECAQVDWGSYGTIRVGSNQRRLSFFVMVLCYSRMMYLEFCVSQTMEHFLACHQNAFSFFNGVPEKVMVDNLKSAVLRRTLGQTPVFNPRYKDFADHCGFAIAPCNVGKAHEKGRVENAVGYVKKNLLAGLDLPDFAALHPAARIWLDTVANVRVHGATRQTPVELFEKEEPFLKPLPQNPFDIATIAQVRASSQFRIVVDANRYSVPAEYAGASLVLKTYPDRICVYDKDKLVARHPRSYDKNKDFEDPDHPKELLKQRKSARDQKIFMRFLTLSPNAETYWQNLEKRRMNPRHHVRKIVALSDIYGSEAVCRAMEDAIFYQAFSSQYIENILEQRARTKTSPGPLHLTRSEDLLDLSIEQPDLTIYQQEDP